MQTRAMFATALGAAATGLALLLLPVAQPAAGAAPVAVDQGAKWTAAAQAQFYTQDQGAQLIPLAWAQALKQPDGAPFLADSLGRYGYLANPAGSYGLPVGFTASGPEGSAMAGMTCAACHTRQITVAGTDYRIDGGPAIVDFQSFLVDLDAAVAAILADAAAFAPFAQAVLGMADPDPVEIAALHQGVTAWYLRYHTLVAAALPTPSWGPGRLDAVGMIFNRLTGLDLGPPPSFLIPENIKRADAPVRYPFLWNASRQDFTQWPGFAANGNDLLGLARNLGEVYGVFGTFEPVKSPWHVLGINYKNNNSANFDGLGQLENLIKLIGPPKWPWAVDQAVAARGKAVFDWPTAQGGCVDCHGIKPGKLRSLKETWATPLIDVGSDSREYNILAWTARTGVLEGAKIPLLTKPLGATDAAFNVLSLSVLGTIIQHYAPIVAASQGAETQGAETQAFHLPPNLKDLQDAFRTPAVVEGAETGPYPYESRVLEGIWATAPYLHNGSVPTLTDLLAPVEQRPAAFKIGPNYDIEKIGLAAEQTKFGDQILTTTDCSARNSGNSRCGHDYGVTLSAADKKALLEYLKTL